MASPIEAVLNTVELLELVLVHLDTKTLLLSRRTSQAFDRTIAGSAHLQRRLLYAVAKDDSFSQTAGYQKLLYDRPIRISSDGDACIEFLPPRLCHWSGCVVNLSSVALGHSLRQGGSWERMVLGPLVEAGCIRCFVDRPYLIAEWYIRVAPTTTLGHLVDELTERVATELESAGRDTRYRLSRDCVLAG